MMLRRALVCLLSSSAFSSTILADVGFVAPQVNGVVNVVDPHQGEIILDATAPTTAGTFKGFDGANWVGLSTPNFPTARFSTTTATSVSGSFTLLDMDSEAFDTDNAFSTTTDKFVAPSTGYYLVNAFTDCTPGTAERAYATVVRVGGSAIYLLASVIKGTTAASLRLPASGSQIVYVNQNDNVEIGAYLIAGSATIDRAQVSIAKIRD